MQIEMPTHHVQEMCGTMAQQGKLQRFAINTQI